MNRRNTKQRKMILDAVQSRRDHPSAEQIYDQVSKEDPHISVGTVYRNLSLLSQSGRIMQIKCSDADRFDLNTVGHDHFVCEECGRMFDIDVAYDDSLDGVCTAEGFHVKAHQTLFRGICPECAVHGKK